MENKSIRPFISFKMGTSVSCTSNKKADNEIFDVDKARTIQWRNLKQYKRYDKFGEKDSSVPVWTKQITAQNQNRIQHQTPVMSEEVLVKPGKLQVLTVQPLKNWKYSGQQQLPCAQMPIQVSQINPVNVHFPCVQNSKIFPVSVRGRKFPQPTKMPEPLVQIVASENNELVKSRGKITPRNSGAALMFSTVPESFDVCTSESTTDSEDNFIAAEKEVEFVRCQNPALSTIWGMHFNDQFCCSESSDVDEGTDVDLVSPDQSCHTANSNSDERSYHGETSRRDYESGGSCVWTRDVDADVSDASSIYGVCEDTILTDYKCYKYCILDNDGLETKVHVKILKDLSEDLLRKAGIIPEDNPLLFGVDPCLKLQRVYDQGDDLYVVSKHDVDMTLKDVLSGSGFPEIPPLAIIYITAELIRKFTKLHEQGIYTSNFGSASVLLAKDGRVCINDFLASALQKLKYQLVTGPGYRDTLEWNPLSTNAQRKKDIYRLGQVIGKLLVGNKFQHWLRSGEDIEMMLLAENTPKPMLQIISRCLRSREETVCMDEINSFASFYFRANDLSSGRLELQQYLNFKIVA